MIKGGPKIINDGLVLCLDAHDAKSYAGEPATNVLQYPESINSGPTKESWSGTITQNAVTAPDGTLTATKIEATSGYVYERLYINTSYNGVSFGVGDTITYSVWIKMLDGTETTSNGPYIWNYNNPTYGIVARDLSGLGPDWKLYKITYTIQSHQTNFAISYSGSNGGVTGTYAIWHPQLEVKSYNTPYVETSRSATNGWVDLSGNSNDGTLVNGVVTGTSHYRSGDVILPNSARYLDFDGSNDYVTISSLLNQETINGSTTKTIILWLNADSYGFLMPFSTGQNGNNRFYYWTSGSLNTWRISNYTSTTNHSTLPSAGTWFCTAIVINGLNITGYLNGVQDYTGSYTAFTTQDFAVLGRHGNLTGVTDPYYYNGKIGQVLVYNKALTAAEILQNYNATKERFI